ncbi:sensor histidine kinase [Paenibacillus albus]|uniref:histidine kinase n=1 Tax=Paenibacillus albus TaxID=2495582 RepID=A0A3Q8X620_9BACL|nr:sensor histidine kinase [Paenibacillus albus]AZN41327.1 sensor histidine kinase [Paenibacillus albus]
MKINHKLMLAYLATILFPILLLTNYYFNRTSDLVIQQISDSYQKVISQANSGIYYNFRFYESIIDNLSVSPAIQLAMTNQSANREKGIYAMNQQIKEAVRSITIYQGTDLKSIEFYSLDQDVFSDGLFLFPVDRLKELLKLSDIPDHRFLVLTKENNNYYYSIVRPIHSLARFNLIGYIKLSMRIPAITNFNEAPPADDEKASLLIVNGSGEIIYSADPSQMGKQAPKQVFEVSKDINVDEGAGLSARIGGTPYVVWYGKIKNTDWTTYEVVPKASIESKINEVRNTFYIYGALSLAVFTLITFLITRQITSGIRLLHNKVTRVGKGFLGTSTSGAKRGKNEITELDRNFDSMIDNLRSLIHQNYVEKLEKREMELNFLQAQINPHFLYNTLDSIKNEIDMDEKDNAVRMVLALSNLFRISVSKGQNIITWQEEIDHARYYMEILGIRFGENYKVTWRIDPDILRMYTLKIILQPILENAIQHGLEGTAGNGEIVVEGVLTDKAIVVSIRDNGVGMSSETVQRLLEGSADGGQGIGIKNVDSRIKMYFGAEFGIEVYSVLGEGTEIRLMLPKMEEREYVPDSDR